MVHPKLKLFILIADGVSLRNFAYTSFCRLANEKGIEVVFWHHTPFDLKTLGFQQIKLQHPRLHWLTTILKNARKHIEISRFVKRNKDDIYFEYLFPLSYKGFKASLKSMITQLLTVCFNSEKGLAFIRKSINNLEQKTTYFRHCKSVLETEKPDVVYCTSQRAVMAIAPLLAAKQLNIPTLCFVFSWDNLPKATLDVTAHVYHVWSNHMKQELLHYHPFVKEQQVVVTGTPQFEPHFNSKHSVSKVDFYNKYQLDINTTYLCYSGDDITTSPKDPLYLRDVAKAIRALNSQGHQLGLIFRRCPVDFSSRYDSVIKDYKDVIVVIEPIWTKKGEMWDTILPLPEDTALLSNLAQHTAAVINLGSSMVFDFAAHNTPCLYMNYNYLNKSNKAEAGVYVYNYVHFRSKPSSDVVFWLNHPNEIANTIEQAILNNTFVVKNAKAWFAKINLAPPQEASSRILERITEIVNKTDN